MGNALNFIQKGFELKKNKSYKQAIEMFYKALEIENNNVEILFQLGELYCLLFNYERAVHYLEQVIKNDSKHILALNMLRQIYFNEKKYEKALEYSEKILSFDMTNKNIVDAIKIYTELHDIKQIKNLESHDDITVKEAIAKSYYSLQEDDDAKRITTEILKTDSNNEAAKIILGKIYFDKNELEKSKEIFQTFDKNTDNPEVLNFLGLFALDDLDFTEAIKDFSKALLSDKTNALYHYNLGNAYFFNGWYKEATTSYLNAIKYDSENLDYRYALAYLYYDMKNFDKSKSEVDYILSLNENHYRTRTLEAVLKLESNDFLGAEQILLTNIKSGFEDAFTDLTLAKVYSELLVFDKAESLLNKVIEQNPQNLDYEIELAKIYIKEKKYKEALIIAEKITESNENYIKAYAIGAQAAFELKNFEKTKDFAQNSILLDVNYATGYFWLSKVRIEENDLDEAVECMKRAIMYDLNNAYYYSEMSKIYEQKSDIKTALEYAKEAESLDNSTEYKILCSQLANQNRKNTNKLIKNLSSIQK